MNADNQEKNHLRTRSIVVLLLMLALVVSMSAPMAHADAKPVITMTGELDYSHNLLIQVGIEHLPHGIQSVNFLVQAWFSQNRTIAPLNQFYSGSAIANVRGSRAGKNFIAPYKGPGDYFIQTLAINPLDNSVIANAQGNPFTNVSFIADLSRDGTALILQLSISELSRKVKAVNFVVTASYAANGATDFTPFYSGGGTAQVCKWAYNCGTQSISQSYYHSGSSTATLTLNVPYQGDGSYFFEIYAYNAKDGSLLGTAFGDPREGTGG